MIQEKLCANRFFVFNSTSKGDVVVKITNNTLLGSTQITMVRGKKSGALKIHLAFMKRNKGPSNKVGNTISVFQIFRMLGVSDPSQILKFISLFAKPQHMKKIFVALQPTFVKLSKIGDDIEYESFKDILRTSLDNGAKGYLVDEVLWREIYEMRQDDGFPDWTAVTKFLQTTARDRSIELARIVNENEF